MLLCGLHDLRPGVTLGAVVSDPGLPDHDLLRPGVVLDSALISTMKRRGVTHVWIEDDFTRDLDAAVAPQLNAARREVYSRLRDGLAECARGTITTSSIRNHRRAVMGLVIEAISSAKYASLTDSLFSAAGQAGHGANVAYLSLLTGLHLESYVVREQKRLDRQRARDMSVLGLAGLLHDIGKTGIGSAAGDRHETHGEGDSTYREHVRIGHKMLEGTGAPARVAHSVLNHHQRFDGGGWPSLTSATKGRITESLSGKRIHIFARIVAAANVLDNLMRDAEGRARPPVAALHEFASSRFDGWFDPVVRRAMLLRLPPFAIGTEVRLSNGQRAIVTGPNLKRPCRPVVRPLPSPGLSDSRGSEPVPSIDLGQRADLTITHALGVDVSGFLYEPPAVAAADGGPGDSTLLAA